MTKLNALLSVSDFSREESGITNGKNVMVPYEDMKSEDSKKSVLLKLSSRAKEYALTGLFLTCHVYLLTDKCSNNLQYAVKQSYETWLEISE